MKSDTTPASAFSFPFVSLAASRLVSAPNDVVIPVSTPACGKVLPQQSHPAQGSQAPKYSDRRGGQLEASGFWAGEGEFPHDVCADIFSGGGGQHTPNTPRSYREGGFGARFVCLPKILLHISILQYEMRCFYVPRRLACGARLIYRPKKALHTLILQFEMHCSYVPRRLDYPRTTVLRWCVTLWYSRATRRSVRVLRSTVPNVFRRCPVTGTVNYVLCL